MSKFFFIILLSKCTDPEEIRKNSVTLFTKASLRDHSLQRYHIYPICLDTLSAYRSQFFKPLIACQSTITSFWCELPENYDKSPVNLDQTARNHRWTTGKSPINSRYITGILDEKSMNIGLNIFRFLQIYFYCGSGWYLRKTDSMNKGRRWRKMNRKWIFDQSSRQQKFT